jgi:hypothetical protein
MMSDGFEHIKSFSSPVDSLAAWAALTLLLFYPSLAVPTLLMWLLKVGHCRGSFGHSLALAVYSFFQCSTNSC